MTRIDNINMAAVLKGLFRNSSAGKCSSRWLYSCWIQRSCKEISCGFCGKSRFLSTRYEISRPVCRIVNTFLFGFIISMQCTNSEHDRTRRDLVLAEAFSPRVANANRSCCNSAYHSLVNSLSATYKKNLAGAIPHPHL